MFLPSKTGCQNLIARCRKAPAKSQDLFDLLVVSFPAVANPARQIRHYAIASGQKASTSLTSFECASTRLSSSQYLALSCSACDELSIPIFVQSWSMALPICPLSRNSWIQSFEKTVGPRLEWSLKILHQLFSLLIVQGLQFAPKTGLRTQNAVFFINCSKSLPTVLPQKLSLCIWWSLLLQAVLWPVQSFNRFQ